MATPPSHSKIPSRSSGSTRRSQSSKKSPSSPSSPVRKARSKSASYASSKTKGKGASASSAERRTPGGLRGGDGIAQPLIPERGPGSALLPSLADRLHPASLDEMWSAIIGGTHTLIEYIRFSIPTDAKAHALLTVWDDQPSSSRNLDKAVKAVGISRSDFHKLAVHALEEVGETYTSALIALSRFALAEESVRSALAPGQEGAEERSKWLQRFGIFPQKGPSVLINNQAISGVRSLESSLDSSGVEDDYSFSDVDFELDSLGDLDNVERSENAPQGEKEAFADESIESIDSGGGQGNGRSERLVLLPSSAAVLENPVLVLSGGDHIRVDAPNPDRKQPALLGSLDPP